MDFNIIDIEELKRQEQYKNWVYKIYATSDEKIIKEIIQDIKDKLIQGIIK